MTKIINGTFTRTFYGELTPMTMYRLYKEWENEVDGTYPEYYVELTSAKIEWAKPSASDPLAQRNVYTVLYEVEVNDAD